MRRTILALAAAMAVGGCVVASAHKAGGVAVAIIGTRVDSDLPDKPAETQPVTTQPVTTQPADQEPSERIQP